MLRYTKVILFGVLTITWSFCPISFNSKYSIVYASQTSCVNNQNKSLNLTSSRKFNSLEENILLAHCTGYHPWHCPKDAIDGGLDPSKLENVPEKLRQEVKKLPETIQNLPGQMRDDWSKLLNSTCGSIFATYTHSVAGSCFTNADYRNKRAESILTNSGLFSSSEFNNVNIKLCNLQGEADGMVPSPNLILLDSSYRNTSSKDLAPLLAHEMVHIRQIKNMGFEKFACEYSDNFVRLGNAAFGDRNPLEREAYDLQATIKTDLSATASNTSLGSTFVDTKDIPISQLGRPSSLDARFRAVNDWAVENSYVAGFPNFHQADYRQGVVYGTILIKQGVERKDIPASELGNPADNEARFRAVNDWAVNNGYAAGFPNFHQADYGQGVVYGTILIKK